jgi:hypothetical protein
MISKRVIAVSALLAFTTVSGVAFAGAQPSDKRWWPNQTLSATASRPDQAMADARDIANKPNQVSPVPHQYRGGPRSIH